MDPETSYPSLTARFACAKHARKRRSTGLPGHELNHEFRKLTGVSKRMTEVAHERAVLDVIRRLVPGTTKHLVRAEADLVAELGFDSLRLLSLVLELERRFGVDVERVTQDIDMATVMKIGDIVAIVAKYGKT